MTGTLNKDKLNLDYIAIFGGVSAYMVLQRLCRECGVDNVRTALYRIEAKAKKEE